LAATFLLTNISSGIAFAADKFESLDKDIAKDKEKVAKKMADITKAEAKMTKDISQYGSDSSQVRDDHKDIADLRNDLVNLNADLYKDVNKKKVAQGQPIEEISVS